MKSTTLDALLRIVQKLILAGYYLIAVLALYFALKVAIFIPMFALNQYMGYEIISRIWLKVIAMFMANALVIHKIVKEYFEEKENQVFENARKQIIHIFNSEEKERQNLISMSKTKVE